MAAGPRRRRSPVAPRRGSRLTLRGWALIGVGIALVGLAFGLAMPPLVWPGFFLVLLPMLSLVAVLVGHPRFEVTRALTPFPVQAGQPLQIDLSIVADRPSLSGTTFVAEDLPASFGAGHHFWLPPQRRGQLTQETYVRHPRRRGRFAVPTPTFRFADLLGLAVRTSGHGTPVQAVVTPMVLALAASPHRAFGHQGETPIPQTAIAGPDDVLVREYRHRDDVRRIHWPSTARTGELMVRREEQAWDPAAWIILDSRAAVHGDPTDVSPSFEWLVTAAASVGVHLLGEGYDVSMVDAEGRVFASRGLEHAQPRQAWLDNLVDAALAGETHLGRAAHEVAQSTSGHLVVALLGRLDADDAERLVATHDASQQCRAIVVAPETADARAEQTRGADVLAAHGWRVATTTVGGALAATWADLADPALIGGRR